MTLSRVPSCALDFSPRTSPSSCVSILCTPNASLITHLADRSLASSFAVIAVQFHPHCGGTMSHTSFVPSPAHWRRNYQAKWSNDLPTGGSMKCRIILVSLYFLIGCAHAPVP